MDFEFRGAASIMALIKVDRGVIEAACLRTLVHENNVVPRLYVYLESSILFPRILFRSRSVRETTEF